MELVSARAFVQQIRAFLDSLRAHDGLGMTDQGLRWHLDDIERTIVDVKEALASEVDGPSRRGLVRLLNNLKRERKSVREALGLPRVTLG